MCVHLLSYLLAIFGKLVKTLSNFRCWTNELISTVTFEKKSHALDTNSSLKVSMYTERLDDFNVDTIFVDMIWRKSPVKRWSEASFLENNRIVIAFDIHNNWINNMCACVLRAYVLFLKFIFLYYSLQIVCVFTYFCIY